MSDNEKCPRCGALLHGASYVRGPLEHCCEACALGEACTCKKRSTRIRAESERKGIS